MANENLTNMRAALNQKDFDEQKLLCPELGQAYDAAMLKLAAYESKDISKAAIAAIADQTATGTAITPEPAVTLAGATLTKDTDYALSYANNTAVGTATVTATGKGSYFFAKSATFNIVAAG